MTENQYELNHLTNDCNGALLQNSLTFTRPDYGTRSIQLSPVSQHVNQNHISSPATSQSELSPLLDIPHGGGSWDCNQLEKSASLILNEAMDSHVVYPFNFAVQSKFNAGDQHSLDSFSKAFSAKNTILASRVGEKGSEGNHVSQILLSPQSGAPSDVSDQEPFSPVTLQSQSQQLQNAYMHNSINSQSMTPDPYQNHQQYQYPQSEPTYKVPFYKSQSQYLIQQQGIQIYQHQFTSYSLAMQKQLSQRDVLEVQEAVGSPTYNYGEEYKTPVQTSFQPDVKGLPLHSPHFQAPQHFCSLSQQNDSYQHQNQQQQPNEQSHLFPFKQDHLVTVDDMQDFSSPKEDICVNLMYPNKRDDFCSSYYQNVDTGVNQPADSTTWRGGVLHINPYRPQWTQMCSSGVQDNQILPSFRNEAVRGQSSKTKLKCVLCQREFKSLPALNGHMRSHGGIRTHPSTLKTTDGQIQLSREVTQTDPMVLPVSVPVKDYQVPSMHSNFLHSHMKWNDFKHSTEPCQQLSFPFKKTKKAAVVGECEAKKEKKRYRHCLVPLVISPYNASLEARGPVLFQSQLRSPNCHKDGFPYTPPPMLSPVRLGSGLFNSVNAGQLDKTVPRVRLCTDNEGDNVTSSPKDKSSSMKPRINIGTDYQACIPDIQSQSVKVVEDTDKANLLWTPCFLDTPEKLQRVDDLLKMACSSVLPGGGTNTEYTLHCFFECRGEVMITLEKLLSLEPLKRVTGSNTDYHYAGSDKWTLHEKRQLKKALMLYNKDFHYIQKMVKTKSVAQCVEYYYTWKERLRLGKRFSTGLTTPDLQVTENQSDTRQAVQDIRIKTRGPQFFDNLSAASVCEVSSAGPVFHEEKLKHSNKYADCRDRSAQHIATGSVKRSPLNSMTSGETESNIIFPCTVCGKVFLKVKSRNAHMKTHRQQDELQFWQLHSLSEQETKTVTPASISVIPFQLPLIPHALSCNIEGDVPPLPINNTKNTAANGLPYAENS